MPAPRSKKEVETVLAAVKPISDEEKKHPFHIVLCAAEKDAGHNGVGFHDYPVWRERWTKIIAEVPGVTTEPADKWPTAEQFKNADVIAFFHDNPVWDATKAPEVDAFLARGGGLVFLHFSINGNTEPKSLADRIGRAWTGNKWLRGDVNLKYSPHEITKGFPESDIRPEEPYWNLLGEGAGTTTIAAMDADGAAQPQVWTIERGGGRIFVCIPCHFTWTHDDPLFRLLAYRGICWTAKRPLNRLDSAIYTGARFKE
jgi:type 1 glutamine amidotransferase